MILLSVVGNIAYFALLIFSFVMWGRLALDVARSLVPAWRPKGGALVVAEFVFVITDPPIKLVRRVIKPIRFGGVALDLSWTLVMVAVFFLEYVATLLIQAGS
ncbi:YggT family protein [soil metagenome]